MKNYLGMFVHWGIYSQLEDHEQVLAKRDMDNAEYEKLVKTFNPVRYDSEEWVKLAQTAGMKYICFTTKHHDGFCMWDTNGITNWRVRRKIQRRIRLRMRSARHSSCPAAAASR